MRPVKMVACHYLKPGVLHCSGRGSPDAFVTEDTATDLVEAGEAVWGNPKKRSYLVFTKVEAEMHRPDRSLTMGTSVMEGCVLGNKRDLALRDAWIPSMVPTAWAPVRA